MRLTIVTIIIQLLVFTEVVASHYIAGEITYNIDSVDNNKVYFEVITYTKPSSCGADACTIELDYGDGERSSLVRVNGDACPLPASCGNQQPDCDHCGEVVNESLKMNIYTGTHIYSNDGEYVVSLSDANRIDGILNIPNSGNIAFYIESRLKINTSSSFVNSSSYSELAPLFNVDLGREWRFNLTTFDTDGDSISYSLIEAMGDGQSIAGYEFPGSLSIFQNEDSIYINQVSGEIIWDNPTLMGDYGLAVKIEEFRDGVFIGSIVKDILLSVVVNFEEGNFVMDSLALNEKKSLVYNFIEGELVRIPVLYQVNAIDTPIYEISGELFNLDNGAIFEIDSLAAGYLRGVISFTAIQTLARVSPYVTVIRVIGTKSSRDLSVLINITSKTSSIDKNNNKRESFSFYPNPATNHITLKFDGVKKLLLKVYSINGELVFKEQIKESTKHLNTSDYKRGVYILEVVEVVEEGSVYQKKFVVE
jgi:hypothetical protein